MAVVDDPAPATAGVPDRYRARPGLICMRAGQITRFGGPEVLDVVDLPDPTPKDGEQLFEVSTAGIDVADTHQPLPAD